MSVIDAIQDAVRTNRSSIPVQCPECGWDAEGTLLLVDDDYAANGWPGRGREVDYRIEADNDQEMHVSECGGCLLPWAVDELIERQPVTA